MYIKEFKEVLLSKELLSCVKTTKTVYIVVLNYILAVAKYQFSTFNMVCFISIYFCNN